MFAKRRHVVLVAVARFLDEPVRAKPAYDPRHLAAAELRKQRAQSLVLYAADGELAAGQCQEEGFIAVVEEVESAIRPCLLVDGPRDFVELVDAIAGIVDGRKEFQVAAGCGVPRFP